MGEHINIVHAALRAATSGCTTALSSTREPDRSAEADVAGGMAVET
jgi:hypothetical protein